MKTSYVFLLIVSAFTLIQLSSEGTVRAETKVTTSEVVKTESGLRYQDLAQGVDKIAENGMQVKVHYTGWVSKDGAKGEQFESSYERGTPIPFVLGTGRVIKGWDEGIKGMKVGGKRMLIVPPELGYGSKPTGNSKIPPSSTLIFEVELVEIG